MPELRLMAFHSAYTPLSLKVVIRAPPPGEGKVTGSSSSQPTLTTMMMGRWGWGWGDNGRGVVGDNNVDTKQPHDG